MVKWKKSTGTIIHLLKDDYFFTCASLRFSQLYKFGSEILLRLATNVLIEPFASNAKISSL